MLRGPLVGGADQRSARLRTRIGGEHSQAEGRAIGRSMPETEKSTKRLWNSSVQQKKRKRKSRFASHEAAFFNVSVATDYASKDLPHPQLCRALGLEILNPPPVSASEKSTTEPRR